LWAFSCVIISSYKEPNEGYLILVVLFLVAGFLTVRRRGLRSFGFSAAEGVSAGFGVGSASTGGVTLINTGASVGAGDSAICSVASGFGVGDLEDGCDANFLPNFCGWRFILLFLPMFISSQL
tara:strand:+ start:966 stop:1334 length:369 start_codon:yes stop_codon:yes gene_type:complete